MKPIAKGFFTQRQVATLIGITENNIWKAIKRSGVTPDHVGPGPDGTGRANYYTQAQVLEIIEGYRVQMNEAGKAHAKVLAANRHKRVYPKKAEVYTGPADEAEEPDYSRAAWVKNVQKALEDVIQKDFQRTVNFVELKQAFLAAKALALADRITLNRVSRRIEALEHALWQEASSKPVTFQSAGHLAPIPERDHRPAPQDVKRPLNFDADSPF